MSAYGIASKNNIVNKITSLEKTFWFRPSNVKVYSTCMLHCNKATFRNISCNEHGFIMICKNIMIFINSEVKVVLQSYSPRRQGQNFDMKQNNAVLFCVVCFLTSLLHHFCIEI